MYRSNLTIIRFILFGLLGLVLSLPALGDQPGFDIGTKKTIKSKILNKEINLLIQLPSDYNETNFKYPVMVVMGYGFKTRFALTAATLELMHQNGEIPPMILVGIKLPDGNGVLIPRNGVTTGPDNYLSFITRELIPFIETSYRTATYRLLYGASNSGLFTVYTLLTNPHHFQAYIASSPMLGWCMELLKGKMAELSKLKDLPSRKLFIIYTDDDYDRVKNYVPEFFKRMEPNSSSWLSHSVELRINEGHVTVNDVSHGLKAIFPTYNPPVDLTTADQFKDHYNKLSKNYGFKMLPPSSALVDVAINHAFGKKLDLAKTLFDYAIALYPNSSYCHAGLGYVYKELGNLEKAKESLQRALKFDPENRWAKRILDGIKKDE